MIHQGSDACMLEDAIEYELPLGALGQLLGAPIARRTLKRLFAYRHAVTRQAFERPGQRA
jgi:ligand-binding SRPBCC domain-containing protein